MIRILAIVLAWLFVIVGGTLMTHFVATGQNTPGLVALLVTIFGVVVLVMADGASEEDVDGSVK